MQQLLKSLVRCNDAITKVVKAMVVVMTILMVSAMLWQVCMRYVFNRPPSWTEELALLLFSWSMLLMLAVGVREAFHVRMDLLIEWLPASGSHSVQLVIDIAIAGFGGYLAWAGITYAVDMYGSTSAAIGYPIVLLYSSAPACGFLIFIYSLELLLSRCLTGERS